MCSVATFERQAQTVLSTICGCGYEAGNNDQFHGVSRLVLLFIEDDGSVQQQDDQKWEDKCRCDRFAAPGL